MTPRISCVAYAVEDSASDAKTARPTTFPMVWWGASAVDSGRPISQECHDRGGWSPESRVIMDVGVKSSGLIIVKGMFWNMLSEQVIPSSDQPYLGNDR